MPLSDRSIQTRPLTVRAGRWTACCCRDDFELRRLLELPAADDARLPARDRRNRSGASGPLARPDRSGQRSVGRRRHLLAQPRSARGGIDRQGRLFEGLRRRAARAVLQGAGLARGRDTACRSAFAATAAGTCRSRSSRSSVNAHGEIVGFCAGNDVSSRDIEGENPLYLPQAKVYDGSCALGPGISLCDADDAAATSRSTSRCCAAGRADLHRRDPHVADQASAAGTGRLPAEGAGLSRTASSS